MNEPERMEILHQWAKRVLTGNPTQPPIDRRRADRAPCQVELMLLPLDAHTLRPLPEKKTRILARDRSEFGVGAVTDGPLDGELFFGEFENEEGMFLGRVIRKTFLEEGLIEYGFQVLDRYRSLTEIYG